MNWTIFFDLVLAAISFGGGVFVGVKWNASLSKAAATADTVAKDLGVKK